MNNCNYNKLLGIVLIESFANSCTWISSRDLLNLKLQADKKARYILQSRYCYLIWTSYHQTLIYINIYQDDLKLLCIQAYILLYNLSNHFNPLWSRAKIFSTKLFVPRLETAKDQNYALTHTWKFEKWTETPIHPEYICTCI